MFDVASIGASTRYITVEQLCATRDSDAQDAYTSTYISAPLIKGTTKYTINVPACENGSHVSGYNVGSCATDMDESTSEDDLEKCTFGTPRTIRAFSDKGIQETAAVVVDDLDNWGL